MRIFRVILITVIFIIGATALVLTFFYLYYNTEHKAITGADRKAAGGQYIHLKQGTTHYEIAGPDTGKVIVLIHGFSVPYFIWDSTFNNLAHQGFRVVRYDEFGRGFSDRPDVDYTRDLYMDQLHELVLKLHLKTPLTVAGISFGGKVARDFTVQYPELVNKTIMIDPAYPGMTPKAPQFITAYQEEINPGDRAAGQTTDFKYPQRHSDWVARYKVQQQYHGFVHALVSTLYNYPVNGFEEDVKLAHTHKPVLLIWGREDQTVPFQYSDSVRKVLAVDFLPVADAGHLPMIEHAALVNRKIVDFLRK